MEESEPAAGPSAGSPGAWPQPSQWSRRDGIGRHWGGLAAWRGSVWHRPPLPAAVLGPRPFWRHLGVLCATTCPILGPQPVVPRDVGVAGGALMRGGRGARPCTSRAVFLRAGSSYLCPASVLLSAAPGPWPPGLGMSLSSLLSRLGLAPGKLGGPLWGTGGERSCPPGLAHQSQSVSQPQLPL